MEQSVEVQVLSWAPEWNLAVENQPRSGRAVGTPTLFRPFSPMNSDSRLRRDGGFFRQEAGASQRFLWHRPFSQKGLYRDMYRPIKIVEMDLPKEVQAIKGVFFLSGQKNFRKLPVRNPPAFIPQTPFCGRENSAEVLPNPFPQKIVLARPSPH